MTFLEPKPGPSNVEWRRWDARTPYGQTIRI
jgi:hypothetical protein